MIIGNNNQNLNTGLNHKYNTNLHTNNNSNNNNIFEADKKALKNGNIFSKNDMADKSLAMLQERYNQGLISIEEFNQKCAQLNRQRNKQ